MFSSILSSNRIDSETRTFFEMYFEMCLLYVDSWRRGGLMVSTFVSGSSGRARTLAGNTMLCSWARHSTLIVPLSTQVYKWIPANLMLGVTLRWTSIPSRGSRNTSSRFMLQKTGDKRWPDGPLGSNAGFTYYIHQEVEIFTDRYCLYYWAVESTLTATRLRT